MAIDFVELVGLLGKTVLADFPGKQVTATIRELHVEGFYGAYDKSTGHRIVIYPSQIFQVFSDEGKPLVQVEQPTPEPSKQDNSNPASSKADDFPF